MKQVAFADLTKQYYKIIQIVRTSYFIKEM